MPRYTIDVGDKFDGILKDLSMAEETTKSEIIRRAIALYHYIKTETKTNGTKVSITNVDDVVLKDIIIP